MVSRRRAPQKVFDRALQQERTALAWDRTGVAMMVAGALFVRAGTPPYHELRHAPGMVAIVFGAILLLLAYRRYDWLHARLHAGEPVTSPQLLVATGVFTVVFAACALYVVIFGG
jgi:uncharacterized membrane protein YidH (DUF202 family)